MEAPVSPLATPPRGAAIPFLSIVIATHERPALLGRAVTSVKRQGRDDIEIVVVADEASRETALAAQACLGPDDIFVRRNGPPGPARSRNLGLSLAHGGHLIFLDDDDALIEGLADRLAQAVRSRPSAVHFWDYHFVVEDRTDLDNAATRQVHSVGLGDVDGRQLFVKNRIPPCATAFPAALVRDLRFDERLRSLEDWDFLLGALSRKIELSHLATAGSCWNNDFAAAHRNPMTDDVLLPDYLSIYRKWPAPDAETRALRQVTLARSGREVPLDWL